MLLHVVAITLWDLGVGTSPVSVRLLGNGHLLVENDRSHRQRRKGWTNASVLSVGNGGKQWHRVPATSGGHSWPSIQSAMIDNESMVSSHPAVVSSESLAPSGPRGRAIHHASLGDESEWAELHEVQMALLEDHANILENNAGSDVRAPEEDPNLPEQNVKEQPEHWSEKAWKTYQTVYKTLAPLRGGVGNVAATFAAMGLGPENCVLKLAYILYSEDDEDDYPYLPRGCGDGFNFLLGAAGPHNYLGIVGTLLLVFLLESGLPAPMHS